MNHRPMGATGRRRRVLLAWELGMGLWHAAMLRAIAEELARRGADVVVALADPVGSWPAWRDSRLRVVSAPRLPPTGVHVDARPVAASFADILAMVGFGDAHRLRPLVAAWDGLIALARPDVVVADHAPSLVVACRGTVPVVQVGLAFSLPPTHRSLFPPLLPRAAADEGALLEVVRAVVEERGHAGPATLPGLFETAGRLVCTLPELDPYRPLRRDAYAGVLGAVGCAPPAPRPAFFAYLAADYPWIGSLVTALGTSGLPGELYLRDAPDEMVATLRRHGLVVQTRPVPIAEAVARASVIVHHGGAGTAEQAILAGRPQLLVPRHLEQGFNASALVHAGVAASIHGSPPRRAEVAARLHEVAVAGPARLAASAWAADLARRPPGDAVAATVARIEHIFAGG